MQTERELIETIDKAIARYTGNFNELESAIGALMAGRHVGWKPLFLIHQRSTIRKYERILGVAFRDVVPDVGPLAHKSVAWTLAQKVSNFWKAVRGEVPGVKNRMIEN